MMHDGYSCAPARPPRHALQQLPCCAGAAGRRAGGRARLSPSGRGTWEPVEVMETFSDARARYGGGTSSDSSSAAGSDEDVSTAGSDHDEAAVDTISREDDSSSKSDSMSEMSDVSTVFDTTPTLEGLGGGSDGDDGQSTGREEGDSKEAVLQ